MNTHNQPAPAGDFRAILIADDIEDDARLLTYHLDRLGYRLPTHIVPNGAEAIAYICGARIYADRRQFPAPRILFLDLRMRPSDGFSVLRWLKANPDYNKFPVLVLTVSMDRHEVTQAYQLGAASFLTKPITRETLAEALRAVNFPPPA